MRSLVFRGAIALFFLFALSPVWALEAWVAARNSIYHIKDRSDTSDGIMETVSSRTLSFIAPMRQGIPIDEMTDEMLDGMLFGDGSCTEEARPHSCSLSTTATVFAFDRDIVLFENFDEIKARWKTDDLITAIHPYEDGLLVAIWDDKVCSGSLWMTDLRDAELRRAVVVEHTTSPVHSIRSSLDEQWVALTFQEYVGGVDMSGEVTLYRTSDWSRFKTFAECYDITFLKSLVMLRKNETKEWFAHELSSGKFFGAIESDFVSANAAGDQFFATKQFLVVDLKEWDDRDDDLDRNLFFAGKFSLRPFRYGEYPLQVRFSPDHQKLYILSRGDVYDAQHQIKMRLTLYEFDCVDGSDRKLWFEQMSTTPDVNLWLKE